MICIQTWAFLFLINIIWHDVNDPDLNGQNVYCIRLGGGRIVLSHGANRNHTPHIPSFQIDFISLGVYYTINNQSDSFPPTPHINTSLCLQLKKTPSISGMPPY